MQNVTGNYMTGLQCCLAIVVEWCRCNYTSYNLKPLSTECCAHVPIVAHIVAWKFFLCLLCVWKPTYLIHLHWAKCRAVLEQCKHNSSSLASHAKPCWLQSLSLTDPLEREVLRYLLRLISTTIHGALEPLETSMGIDRNIVSDTSALLTNIETFKFISTVEAAKVILSVRA